MSCISCIRPRPRPRPPSTGAARALALLTLGGLVLGLHALLLGSLPRLPGTPGRGDAPLQVRQIARSPVAVERATPAAAAPVPPAPSPRAAARARAAAIPAQVPATVTATTDMADAAPATAGGEALPVYATRLPPAATLQYTVQRDAPGRSGFQAELRWRPGADGYTLTLGFAAAGWASVGALDAHGIAPERHVETRRGRELRAANFQRESGRITFSGPAVDYPLLPGAQDRLSWMLQLAGVLAADPTLGDAGREVQLFVAGVRGDAALWTFTTVGRETAELPSGTVEGAVHLHREPLRPYDTRVDIWLDPARHHLPVRMRLQTRGDGDVTDFQLTTLAP